MITLFDKLTSKILYVLENNGILRDLNGLPYTIIGDGVIKDINGNTFYVDKDKINPTFDYILLEDSDINNINYLLLENGSKLGLDVNNQPEPQALNLTFDNISNANLLVGDASNVADWNTFFDLPTYGNPFTSVEVVGNEVKLFGGSNIKAKPALMYNQQNAGLISIDDQVGCITSVGGDAFSYNYDLVTVSLPACTIIYGPEDSPQNDYGGFGECVNLVNINAPLLEEIGDNGFAYSTSLVEISFPSLLSIGNSSFVGCSSLSIVNLPNLTTSEPGSFASCISLTTISLPQLTIAGGPFFTNCISLTTIDLPSCTNLGGTVGDDSVFQNISGNNITLTVPSALTTCNSGNPDGDIQYLQANNTVTIITV